MTYFATGSFLLFSAATLCASQQAVNPLSLTSGHPVSVVIAQGRTTTLRLNFAGSEAEEIFLDTAAPNVSFRIISSGGVDIKSGRIVTPGWAAIPLGAGGPGSVELLLNINEPVEDLAGVRVRADQLSIPRSALDLHERAAEAFASAQSLRRSLRAEDIRLAINEFQKAADEWGGCEDLYGEALALGGKAESQIELSRYQEAMKTLKHALGLDAKNAYVRGWLTHLSARVYLDQWEPGPAKGFAEETLQLGQQIGDLALIAQARTDLAGAAYWNGDADANQIADQAHAEAIAAGLPETLALERRWKAWLEENDEHNTRATSVMSEAEAYFRQAGDKRTALEATGQIAQAINLNGDPYFALEKLLELEPVAKAAGNSVDHGTLLGNIGQIYLRLAKPRFAEVYLHLAVLDFASAQFQRGLMLVHGSLCEVELRLNEVSDAVSDCQLSLDIAMQVQDPVFIGIAECQLGLADRKAGRTRQAFADFTEAISKSQSGGDLRWESKERIQLGEILEESGDLSGALNQFMIAERLVQDVTDSTSLLEAQYSIAKWYTHDGQYEKAHAKLEPALKTLESERQRVSDITLQATYFAAERKCYELAVELGMREFERDSNGGGDALALEFSEQSRARGLLDSLKAGEIPGERDGSRAQFNLMKSNLATNRAFDRRLKLLVGGGTRRDLQVSTAELTQALAKLEVAERGANSVSNPAPKPMTAMAVAEIGQASLTSQVTFFEYLLGDERSYLWVISAGRPKSYILPSRQRLEDMVKQWQRLASSHDAIEADTAAKLQNLSAQLSCILFVNRVDAETKRIVVVPDGGLTLLPFAALPENGCSKKPGEPLVVRHVITLVPSLSIFLSSMSARERHKFRGEVAVIADPVFDMADPRAASLKTRELKRGSYETGIQDNPVALPRLLNTGYEASAIQATVRMAAGKHAVFLAQGFDANIETILSPAMQKYRIWHLATHGVYDETMPEFSGLVFSMVGPDGSPRFGFLKAHDIGSLKVPAELVVLSACDSASGENVNGEGVMGLSYAFLRAGAKQVISTLWSVEDAESKELMVAFYKEFMRNGRNAAESLRRSQIKLMRNPATSAPYYWAGFTLTTTAAD